MWLRRLVPVALLGALSVAYVAMRPWLADHVAHLRLLEFPLGLAVVGALLVAALRRPRREAPPPAPREWRRHEQVIRTLPDPEAERLGRALKTWVDEGREADAAAAILARLAGRDAEARERAKADLLPRMERASSRRARLALLREHSRSSTPGA